jgi:hypothetical protein
MGGEQMAASEATLSSPSLLLYSTPMEPASSTCNCTAASDGATSALPPVSHSILPSTSGTAMADVIPDLRPHAPEGCGSPSPAAVRPVAQSLLCTFLI